MLRRLRMSAIVTLGVHVLTLAALLAELATTRNKHLRDPPIPGTIFTSSAGELHSEGYSRECFERVWWPQRDPHALG